MAPAQFIHPFSCWWAFRFFLIANNGKTAFSDLFPHLTCARVSLEYLLESLVTGLCPSSTCLAANRFSKIAVPLPSLPSLGTVTLAIAGNLMDLARYLISMIYVSFHSFLWGLPTHPFAHCFSVKLLVFFILVYIIINWLDFFIYSEPWLIGVANIFVQSMVCCLLCFMVCVCLF